MSVFDGMSGVLASVFGAPITYLPQGGTPRVVQSIFRDMPVEAVDQDGHPVLITSPSWRVQHDLVPELVKGDRIEPGNGKTYAVFNVVPSGSPASDANVICELERIFA